MRTNLTKLIAPSFYKVHQAIKKNLCSTIWLYGGRGSLKSSFTAIETVLLVMDDPDANAICFRKVADTLKTSVYANIQWAINQLGMEEYWRFTVNPMEAIYIPTGQKIIFKGLDDYKKVKSIKLPKGYFKVAWFEEIDEFDGMEEIRNVVQSIGRGGDDFKYFMTHNPPRDPDHWVNAETKNTNPHRYDHYSTYLMAPFEWNGTFFHQNADILKEQNFLAYQHEYLGIPTGHSERIVFKDKVELLEFDEPDPRDLWMNRFFYGADWGFANDPTAVIRCFVKSECLYISHEAGGVGIDFPELIPLFKQIPNIMNWEVQADCSRPETISWMNNNSFQVIGAKKWAGSVEDTVSYMLGFRKIYVHTRCPESYKEFNNFSYKVDKVTKKILPVIDPKQPNGDHYIDATRYSLTDYVTREISILDVIG